jgi:hypothetical protein
LLRKHGFKVSMRGKGNCYDKSAVESLFKSLKAELVWRRNWKTRREVEVALFEYINGFYNPRRKHSALGWKSPAAFEQWAAQHEHLTGTEPVQVQSPCWTFATATAENMSWLRAGVYSQVEEKSRLGDRRKMHS